MDKDISADINGWIAWDDKIKAPSATRARFR
jgi:hypothetical protein